MNAASDFEPPDPTRSCPGIGIPADPDSAHNCLEVGEDMIASPNRYALLVRHYLDPTTGTGPHRDALPRHRLLKLDRLPY